MFHTAISLENLFAAWREFRRGKNGNDDVREFALSLEDRIFALHKELLGGIWKPDAYIGFYIKDPKLRHIHKASVRDRVLHQAVYRIIGPLFERKFIAHSYSSRLDKGTHAGVNALESFGRKESWNWTRKTYALSGDIRRFFDSADHRILDRLVRNVVNDEHLLGLIAQIVASFAVSPGKGIPLGNVTSQLFANVYLDAFDQFVKRQLKVRRYVRYCDDFIIVSQDRSYLESLIIPIARFLERELALELHPRKLEIRSFQQGIDFLGYVVRPHHRVFRTRTKRRMFRNIRRAQLLVSEEVMPLETIDAMVHSYRGMLAHSRSQGIRQALDSMMDC